MKDLIDRLRLEKKDIETKEKDHHSLNSSDKKNAYISGKHVADKWIKTASYKEIKHILNRSNPRLSSHYLEIMQAQYFSSIETVCPHEAREFKWSHINSFMNGFYEGVDGIWDAINSKVDA